jgi:hypothetical protein
MPRTRWLIAAIAGLGLLTACTTPMFTMPPGPPDFRVGYYDGCDAGYAYAGSPFYEHSDVTEPPVSSEDYVTGWQEGFVKCKSSYQRIQRALNVAYGPP